MELEDKYEKLLIEIHESIKERFDYEYVTQRSLAENSNLTDELRYLIETELVEFDKSDNAYYLTYEGYEVVEAIKLRGEGKEISEIENRHVHKKSKINGILSVIGGFVVLIIAIMAIMGIRPSKKFELTPELLNQLHNEVSSMKDSIKNEQINSGNKLNIEEIGKLE